MASTINADNGVVSGSSGLKSTADTSGVLALQSNGTTGLTLNTDLSVTFAGAQTLSGGTANGVTYLNGSKVLTSGSALTFDGTNLGVGVTPSAWFSSIKAIDVNTYGSVASSGNAFELYANSYFSSGGSFTYKSTAAASRYQQTSGQHQWFTAPSGTAGNAISFTQAMTLDASGNLGIGTTSPVNLSGSGDLTAQRIFAAQQSAAFPALAFASDTNTGINWPSADTLSLNTGGTERTRIDSSGNLLVGATSGSGIGERLGVTGVGIVTQSSASTNRGLFGTFGGSTQVVGTFDSIPVEFRTGNTEQARLTTTGAWSFGSSGTATGTSGQVLTSGGSGAAPTWASPAAGGSWQYITTVTASNSATVTIENAMTAYKMYVVVFTGVLNANNDTLRCQIKLDGSYATGSFYETLMQRCVANSTSFIATADSGTSMFVAYGLPANIADGAASGVIYIPNPSQNTRKTLYSIGSGNYRTQSNMTGTYGIAGVMTGIKFFTPSATILAGTFILYGISNS